MDEGPAAEVVSNGHCVGVKELMNPMQRSVCWLAVERWDVRVLKALDELGKGGGCHGGGLSN